MHARVCCCSVCSLRDNPTPVEFPISVLGAKPSVAVRLASTAAAAGASDAGAKGGPRAGFEAGGISTAATGAVVSSKLLKGKASKVAAELVVQFDRLLLNRKDSHAFIISNTGVLPFKWQLAGASELPPEFHVWPAAGELAARSDVRVMVEFSALKKQELAELLTLEVRWPVRARMHVRACMHCSE